MTPSTAAGWAPYSRRLRTALTLHRWAGLAIPLDRWAWTAQSWKSDVDALVDAVERAIMTRAGELAGRDPFKPRSVPYPRGFFAEKVAAKLDVRFLDQRRLAAAVAVVERGISPSKAFRNLGS